MDRIRKVRKQINDTYVIQAATTADGAYTYRRFKVHVADDGDKKYTWMTLEDSLKGVFETPKV